MTPLPPEHPAQRSKTSPARHRWVAHGILLRFQGHRKTGCPCFSHFCSYPIQQSKYLFLQDTSRVVLRVSEHQHRSHQPGDSAFKQCLEKIFKASRTVPIFVVVDALDECPDTSGLQLSREKVLALVLALVQELVGFHLPNLRLCITSRPKVDILNVLEPLTSTSSRLSLHDDDGQRKDIADHISSVVYSDKNIMRWREKDKELVVETLSTRADGMYERGSPFTSQRFLTYS